MAISRESKGEWVNERRVKELAKRGYGPENIEAMMYSKHNNIRGQQVRKWLKHEVKSGEMPLDGKL